MTIKIETTIRDTKVTFFADHFWDDPSVGIPLQPEELWCTDEEGNDFKLSDAEEIHLTDMAVEEFLAQEQSDELEFYLHSD